MSITDPLQPPAPGTQDILPLVIRDLQEKAERGKLKYGTYLQADNGREALLDAYQESLDLAMYLRQKLTEMGYE